VGRFDGSYEIYRTEGAGVGTSAVASSGGDDK
jgi:hypothetical protein